MYGGPYGVRKRKAPPMCKVVTFCQRLFTRGPGAAIAIKSCHLSPPVCERVAPLPLTFALNKTDDNDVSKDLLVATRVPPESCSL